MVTRSTSPEQLTIGEIFLLCTFIADIVIKLTQIFSGCIWWESAIVILNMICNLCVVDLTKSMQSLMKWNILVGCLQQQILVSTIHIYIYKIFYMTELMKPQIMRGKNFVMQIVHGQMKLRCKHWVKSNKCIVCFIHHTCIEA